ncbi:hypothetical protein AMTRI_Chr07g81160 [Amborella trichopoda]
MPDLRPFPYSLNMDHETFEQASNHAQLSSDTRDPDLSLIPGLPDDIALLCLVRVPRKYHPLLKSVSRRWRALVHSEAFYACRQNLRLAEAWVYSLCRDASDQVHGYVREPTKRRWRPLKGVPPQCSKRYGMAFGVLGHRLYLLGGCRWLEDASTQVHYYDAITDEWGEAAPLVKPRCHFVCESLEHKLYAIGGMGLSSETLHSFEVYDPIKNEWTLSEDPDILADPGESLSFEGNIYIRHVSPDVVPSHYAAMCRPSAGGKWQPVDGGMVMGLRGPAVVVGSRVYMVDQGSGGVRLMVWDEKERDWVGVGRLSGLVVRGPCKLAGLGGRGVVVVGRGMGGAVVDLKASGSRGVGVLVGSSVVGLGGECSNNQVICCESIAV